MHCSRSRFVPGVAFIFSLVYRTDFRGFCEELFESTERVDHGVVPKNL